MQTGTLSLVRGDDQTVGFTITQPDGVTPYDLTGCTMLFYVRRSTYYSPLILTVTTTVFSDPTGGVGSFTFVPADTASMDDNPYFFEMKLIDTAAKTTTLMTGELSITPVGGCP